MKRFHVHVAVDDLQANIRFYSAVFGQASACCAPKAEAVAITLRRAGQEKCC